MNENRRQTFKWLKTAAAVVVVVVAVGSEVTESISILFFEVISGKRFYSF